MDASELARLAGVHVSTARRWRARGLRPALVDRYLELLYGELGPLSPTWRGWALRAGELVSPEGTRYTPGAVRAGVYDRDQVRELRRQLEAATCALLSAPERLELRAALAHAHNALEAASAATLDLVDTLADPERQRLHEALDSTVAARARLGL